MLTATDREDEARHLSGADDDVVRLGRAMNEVPLPQGPLLALDDEQRLAREDEKVLLIGFPASARNPLRTATEQ